MKKYFLYAIVIIVIGVVAFFAGSQMGNFEKKIQDNDYYIEPTHEEAELSAFEFILNFIQLANIIPPNVNEETIDKIYDILSESARERISKDSMARDLANFIGVESAPEHGANVEDLQIGEDGNTAIIIVGLNYSDRRIIRNINLVIEEGKWKVDNASIP